MAKLSRNLKFTDSCRRSLALNFAVVPMFNREKLCSAKISTYTVIRLSTFLLYNVNEMWCNGTGINNVLGVYQGMIKAKVLMRYD